MALPVNTLRAITHFLRSDFTLFDLLFRVESSTFLYVFALNKKIMKKTLKAFSNEMETL